MRFHREKEMYESTYGRVESKKTRKKNLKKSYQIIKKYLNKREDAQAKGQLDDEDYEA